MIKSKRKIRITNTWVGIEPVREEVIEYGYWHPAELGKQYYVDGFFGMSQKYASWDDAMEDTARRHGFTFVYVGEREQHFG